MIAALIAACGDNSRPPGVTIETAPELADGVHTLCYWERERVLIDRILSGESGSVPTCTM